MRGRHAHHAWGLRAPGNAADRGVLEIARGRRTRGPGHARGAATDLGPRPAHAAARAGVVRFRGRRARAKHDLVAAASRCAGNPRALEWKLPARAALVPAIPL